MGEGGFKIRPDGTLSDLFLCFFLVVFLSPFRDEVPEGFFRFSSSCRGPGGRHFHTFFEKARFVF